MRPSTSSGATAWSEPGLVRDRGLVQDRGSSRTGARPGPNLARDRARRARGSAGLGLGPVTDASGPPAAARTRKPSEKVAPAEVSAAVEASGVEATTVKAPAARVIATRVVTTGVVAALVLL